MDPCIRLAEALSQPLTEAFRSVLQEAQQLLEEQVRVPLNPHQYEALVSLLVDIIVGKVDGEFEGSTLVNYLNNEEFNLAAAEFQNWSNREGQLIQFMWDKRQKEMDLFLNGRGH